jgi:heterodisulfide reductase subunit B
MSDAKVVPKNNFYLFKSCIAGSIHPGIEISTRYILDKIGVAYDDDPKHSSCTGFAYHCGVMPLLTNLALNARNLSLASESENKNILCTCPTSYGNLKECKDILSKDVPLNNATSYILEKAGRKLDTSSPVNHVSELFLVRLNDIKEKSIHSLSGVRAVTHHGCHYSKIFYGDVLAGNYERPTVLDDILKGFSCEIAEYTERALCCGMGFHHTMIDSDYPLEVLKRKFASIKEVSPDIIVTQCPGCIFNFDYYQEKLSETLGPLNLPVLYISELIALLMGADPEDIGIGMHIVPVEPFLKKAGIGVVK